MIGVICSIISSIITWLALRAYNGGKHFGGVFSLIRLITDCYRAGVINVFPNRKAYSLHKDHCTGAEYIKKCEHSLYYVGYWLASSISMGEIINSFKELAQKNQYNCCIFRSF